MSRILYVVVLLAATILIVGANGCRSTGGGSGGGGNSGSDGHAGHNH
jgi:hypothetical protein